MACPGSNLWSPYGKLIDLISRLYTLSELPHLWHVLDTFSFRTKMCFVQQRWTSILTDCQNMLQVQSTCFRTASIFLWWAVLEKTVLISFSESTRWTVKRPQRHCNKHIYVTYGYFSCCEVFTPSALKKEDVHIGLQRLNSAISAAIAILFVGSDEHQSDY